MPAGANRPLAGVTVLDLGQVYQGPYATLLMAKAGADVIKIEPPQGEQRRQPFPRERRQVLAELHCVDPEPALEQRERGVARPAADLQHVGRRWHEGGHGIEERGRWSPSRAGVELGHLVEAAAALVGGSSRHFLSHRWRVNSPMYYPLANSR